MAPCRQSHAVHGYVAGCCCEELGLSFRCLSASDPSPAAQAFLQANFSRDIMHIYQSMEEQMHSVDGVTQGALTPHLAVWGTPCDPFSRQNAKKRFCCGATAHSKFDTTFLELKEWLQIHNPGTGVMEQVQGFDMPTSPGNPTSPLAALLGYGCGTCEKVFSKQFQFISFTRGRSGRWGLANVS